MSQKTHPRAVGAFVLGAIALVLGAIVLLSSGNWFEPKSLFTVFFPGSVRGLNKGDIRRGDVAGPVDKPPKVVKEFSAQITVLNHPSAIAAGYTPVFHAHTAQVACIFTKLEKKLDPKTGGTKEENPEFLKTGDAAIVRIQPTKPMVLENAKEFPQLGRFAIRDMGQTVAAGMCISTD